MGMMGRVGKGWAMGRSEGRREVEEHTGFLGPQCPAELQQR